MCRFKSGIILKNRIVVAPGENDSHSDLLESIGVKDDYIGAYKTFVRAELIPEDGEWWTDPEGWKFVVDQDILPDWFDKKEYEKLFRESVKDWWKKHVLIDQKIDILQNGYYRLKRCEVKKICGDVIALLDNSTVGEMLGSSTVREMHGSSTVEKMHDSSAVREMYDSSTVRDLKIIPISGFLYHRRETLKW